MILRKNNWQSFINHLAVGKTFVPQTSGGAIMFKEVSPGGEITLESVNTTVPLKSVVFPQTQTMFQYSVGGTGVELPGEMAERVVLGVRPCDARAMTITDHLFAWDVDDPYYFAMRNKTTILGMSCTSSHHNCFCTSVGCGPASVDGMDILMTDLGGRYLLEPVTGKGEVLLEELDMLEVSSHADIKEKMSMVSKVEQEIARKIETGKIVAKLPELWESDLWAKVSASCLGCGICTYLCPTCHCFDIQDETEGFAGRRCRMWDSCMFKEYTLHASGHNPRPSRLERTRNRINHKYSYFVKKFDVIACVGCGRCINYCPVNIDLLDILTRAREA